LFGDEMCMRCLIEQVVELLIDLVEVHRIAGFVGLDCDLDDLDAGSASDRKSSGAEDLQPCVCAPAGG
jgi:hypothetical protein